MIRRSRGYEGSSSPLVQGLSLRTQPRGTEIEGPAPTRVCQLLGQRGRHGLAMAVDL